MGDFDIMPNLKLYNNLDQNIVDLGIPCQFGRETGELTLPEDDAVSTLHGEFSLSGSSVFITDLGSTNGTYLNDQKLAPHEKTILQDDDLLEFGEQSFHLGLSENFDPINVAQRYQEKKAERLRQMLQASKTEKLNSINAQLKTLQTKKKTIQEQLNLINDKYKKGKVAEKSLIDKKLLIDKNIANFPDITAKKSIEFDQLKRKLFKQKTDLDDQIKLLNISGNEEEQSTKELVDQLNDIKEKISSIAIEKKNFPEKVKILIKNQEIMKRTISETSLKLEKVEELINRNESKYLPLLNKIELQLEQLEREKAKLDSDSTKTRQL